MGRESSEEKSRGYVEEIRYADDFVICVKYKEDAEDIIRMLRERLKKFGLELSEEKTRLILFGRYAKEKQKRPDTFDFLGFTHYCGTSRSGKFKIGRQTSRKKLISKIKEMNLWLKNIRNVFPIEDVWKTLKQKLRGHYMYYGIGGNYRKIAGYYFSVIRLVFKWLNRRSQRKSYNWQGFIKYLTKYPLPKPKLYHAYGK